MLPAGGGRGGEVLGALNPQATFKAEPSATVAAGEAVGVSLFLLQHSTVRARMGVGIPDHLLQHGQSLLLLRLFSHLFPLHSLTVLLGMFLGNGRHDLVCGKE